MGGDRGVDFEREREGAAAVVAIDDRAGAGVDGLHEGLELEAERFAGSYGNLAQA